MKNKVFIRYPADQGIIKKSDGEVDQKKNEAEKTHFFEVFKINFIFQDFNFFI